MRTLDRQFIDGEFVTSHGRDVYPVSSAITGEQLAEAILGDEVDANRAVEAAKRALPAWSATTLEERGACLQNLADAFRARRDEMITSLVEEFGTPRPTAAYIVDQSRDWFADAKQLLTNDVFVEQLDPARRVFNHGVPAPHRREVHQLRGVLERERPGCHPVLRA